MKNLISSVIFSFISPNQVIDYRNSYLERGSGNNLSCRVFGLVILAVPSYFHKELYMFSNKHSQIFRKYRKDADTN